MPLRDENGSRNGELGQLTQITRAMVAIYKEQFGRGPRHAHSHYAGANAIVCFLEGTLTPLERKLADEGEHQRLRDIRIWFQYTAEDAFCAAVEAATGRQVDLLHQRHRHRDGRLDRNVRVRAVHAVARGRT